MYYLRAEASFDAAHFLAHYQGKCSNIHGHHWIVQIRISGSTLQTTTQERGMLVDFSQLKSDLKRIADELEDWSDGNRVNWSSDVSDRAAEFAHRIRKLAKKEDKR